MDPHVLMGIELYDDEKYVEAIEVFDEYPTHVSAHFERARALLELGRDDEAEQGMEAALAIKPGYPGLRDELARLYGERGRHEDAARIKLEQLRAEPDGPSGMGVSPGDWDECAGYHAAAGDADAAAAILEEYFLEYEGRVTMYVSSATSPMRSYARLLSERGEHERALSFARRAYEHEHRVPADVFDWIRVLARAGHADEAATVWHAFRATSYWDRYEAFPDMVALHDELTALVAIR